jgi:hypothetical protein
MEKYAGEKKIVSHRYEKRNTVTFVFCIFYVKERSWDKFFFTIVKLVKSSTKFVICGILFEQRLSQEITI